MAKKCTKCKKDPCVCGPPLPPEVQTAETEYFLKGKKEEDPVLIDTGKPKFITNVRR